MCQLLIYPLILHVTENTKTEQPADNVEEIESDVEPDEIGEYVYSDDFEDTGRQ